jgi:hypothetical protein
MPEKQLKTWGPLILLVLCVSAARAQDSVDAPKPAMAGDNTASLQSGAPTDIPDTRPLAGVQNLSLGSQSTSHSFLLPSFGVTSAVQFNPGNSSVGNSSPTSTTYVSGRLALNKISGRSELLLDYLAGGGFSSYSNQGNSVIQSLDFSETVRGGRWSQTFGEQFSYLPASSFNFGGLGGLGNFGVGLGSVGVVPGFRQDLIPNQSILTNGAARISNATMAQTTYALGYRSSLSFFGTYGQLHFLDNGFQNSSSVSAGAGYNYLLSPLNSMSVSYGFGRFMFANLPVGADSHTVQLSFARRITGRLSFQIGAGPDFQIYRSPLAGPATTISWALNSGLNYQLRSWQSGFGYTHSLSGGSGVLAGAETDMFSGHLARSFGSWQTGLSAGYSRNRSLQQTSINLVTPKGWFGGAQVSRQFASFGSLFISYNVSRQSGLGTVCSLPACATNQVTQTVSIGYNWGFRPIILE